MINKDTIKTIIYGFVAAIFCLFLPTIATIQFEKLQELGWYIFILPTFAVLLAIGLLWWLLNKAVSQEIYFAMMLPAGLLPFLCVIAWQEHSWQIFAHSILALTILTIYHLFIIMALKSYNDYGLSSPLTIFWFIIVVVGLIILKWTNLPSLIEIDADVKKILDERLSRFFISSFLIHRKI